MYRDRRYGAAEVRAILERAAKQKSASMDAPPRTLEEIEALGEELGLSREAVRAAANGGSSAAPRELRTAGDRIRGGPGRIRREVVVPGRIDASKHEALVEVLRDRLGDMGTVEVLGDTLSCTFGGANARILFVRMRPVEDGTSIRFEEPLSLLAGSIFGGTLGGIGGGIGGGLAWVPAYLLHWPGWTIPLCILFVVAAAYALSRALFASRARARAAEADEIVDALAAALDAPKSRVDVPKRVAGEDDEEPVVGEEHAAGQRRA